MKNLIKAILAIPITIAASTFVYGYAQGNNHAHQVRSVVLHHKAKTEYYQAMMTQRIALDEIIVLVDAMNPLQRTGYVMGLKNIDRPMGTTLSGYLQCEEDTMKEGYIAMIQVASPKL